jgi:hypothetical protein
MSSKRKRRSQPSSTKISTFLQRDIWIGQMFSADLSLAAKVVAARIALHLNIDDGRCYPSVAALTKGTGVSERHIPRVFAALERSGWLAITRSPGREWGYGGRGHANSFRLMTPETLTQSQGLAPETLTWSPLNPDTMSPQQRSNSERGRGLRPRAPLTRGGDVGKELVLVGRFEDLRAAWPRPWVDDDAADRWAFEQACRQASVEEIIAGALPWVEAMEARYLPGLAKWLSARGWEKPPPKKPKPKPRGNGKVDLSKLTLTQEAGWIEDDDGNLINPELDGSLQ